MVSCTLEIITYILTTYFDFFSLLIACRAGDLLR